MPQYVHETAPTQFVQVGDVRVAYRRFGKRGTLPLLLLNYFAANMDDWDPKITNGLAAERDVIILDYPGIGRSTGATPSTVAAITQDFVGFCRALYLNSDGFRRSNWQRSFLHLRAFGLSLGNRLCRRLASRRLG